MRDKGCSNVYVGETAFDHLRESLLAGTRPRHAAYGDEPLFAMVQADHQSPLGTAGGSRRLVAKDVNERGETERLGTGQRVPELIDCSSCLASPPGISLRKFGAVKKKNHNQANWRRIHLN